MPKWTVIVDDDCGTTRVYYVEANSPNQAASFAERIYLAHASVGGRTQYVLSGEQVLEQFEGSQKLTPIRLYLTEEEKRFT